MNPDPLDQILRLLPVTGEPSEAQPRDAASNQVPRPTLAAELEARAAARVAPVPPPEPVRAQNPRPFAEPVHLNDDLARLEAATEVAEKLGLGFHLGSAVERIAIAAGEGSAGEEKLHEAGWLIDRYLDLMERRPVCADLHVTMSRLAREGDAIAGLKALAAALGEQRPKPAETARFSTALTEPERAPEPAPPEPAPIEPAPPEHVAPEHASPEPVQTIVAAHTTFGHELALTGARALIVVVAVTALVLVLTLVAQWLR
jgi:hypothetical protein